MQRLMLPDITQSAQRMVVAKSLSAGHSCIRMLSSHAYFESLRLPSTRFTAVWEGHFSAVALAKEAKEKIVTDFRRHESDTGSPQVQIALLSQRISELTEHFKTHKKDNHSRRGLLKMVQNRRSLLNYLKKTNIQQYHEVVGRLGLRH